MTHGLCANGNPGSRLSLQTAGDPGDIGFGIWGDFEATGA